MRFTLFFLSLIVSAQATLTATFRSGDKSVTREVRMPALRVETGQPPVNGFAPGAFSADFKGQLVIPKRYRLFFSFETDGKVSLKIDGKEVPFENGISKRMRLNPGEVPFEVHFESPENGAGFFRIFWQERKAFPREPIPSTAFTESKIGLDPAHIIANHNCLKCHAAGDLGNHAMPELQHTGPDLTLVGDRLHEAWLTRWIAQPEKLKPTTTMPAMVDHTKPEGAQAAADLGAYLASLKSDAKVDTSLDQALSQTGGAHFHNLGCAACHTLPSRSDPDFDNKRIPLNNLAAKFKGDTLQTFLKNPGKHYPAIKMPNFRLSDDEAKSLAGFLTKQSTGRHTPDPSEFPPGDPARGKELASSLNCAACHQGLPASTTTAPKFSELTKWTQEGCLGPDDKRGKAPRLNLTKEEKAALTPATLPSLKYDTPAAYATRTITSLRCASCHQHDTKNSLLSLMHGETKPLVAHDPKAHQKVEQSRPPLTHMGAMLHTPFFEKMLLGTQTPRPRPWLDMRMPAFPHHSKNFALGMAHQHGLPASKPDDKAADPAQVKLGAQLAGMTGYACFTCHAQNENPAVLAFEVQGINFGLAHERLRSSYYHQWMQNPMRLVPDTKMTRYTNPDGTGIRSDILEGDSYKQFEAIRAYFRSLKKP